MGIRPVEIVALVLSFAIPVGLFAALLTPGALAAAFTFLFSSERLGFVLAGLAAFPLCFLLWRRTAGRRRRQNRDAETFVNFWKRPYQ